MNGSKFMVNVGKYTTHGSYGHGTQTLLVCMDVFPFPFGGIFRFQPLVFGGVQHPKNNMTMKQQPFGRSYPIKKPRFSIANHVSLLEGTTTRNVKPGPGNQALRRND